ncbi:DNA polymerase [Gemmobacter megaterium]|uniref:Type-4 uracil-DNA glycosylase n=2 Tax=Gemmobacter megaterium TaxID=1086013 RepID=A0A1N7Q3L6_9RHOB|nr:uracil-DNA glycosylase [Gemmobacter megaterium]SIT17460.1 DNA polymerase [Gemmobacter megaterium]
MIRGMSLGTDPRVIAAMLDWQAELGADEWIGDQPVDRFAVAQAARAAPAIAARPMAPAPPPEPARADPVAEARQMAAQAMSLEQLADLQASYAYCDLKKGARNFVFCDGRPGARVMLVGEAPGADEDRQGKPFVGRAGQLLDRMLGAIGLDRHAQDMSRAVYITNVLPWRPPGNRDPEPAELAMMLPFVRRHIELAAPEVLVLIGNHSCQALLGQRGITKLRGRWTETLGRPVLPMLHPAYLLRNPYAKRDSWADLLMLQARLRGQ